MQNPPGTELWPAAGVLASFKTPPDGTIAPPHGPLRNRLGLSRECLGASAAIGVPNFARVRAERRTLALYVPAHALERDFNLFRIRVFWAQV